MYFYPVNRIASRSMKTDSTEFDSIPTDSIFTNEPMKRQILITLGPNTRVTPKVKTLITWLMGKRYLKHQLNVQVIRKPHQQTPEWKVSNFIMRGWVFFYLYYICVCVHLSCELFNFWLPFWLHIMCFNSHALSVFTY